MYDVYPGLSENPMNPDSRVLKSQKFGFRILKSEKLCFEF